MEAAGDLEGRGLVAVVDAQEDTTLVRQRRAGAQLGFGEGLAESWPTGPQPGTCSCGSIPVTADKGRHRHISAFIGSQIVIS